MTAGRASILPPTQLTRGALFATATLISATGLFLIWNYESIPWLLPVHFGPNGQPNGWQYKTVPRVLLPVFIQLGLAVTLGGIGALLLSRSHGELDASAPDVKAATVAAEAVIVLATIWVAFQGYGAYALVTMWANGYGALGPWYYRLEWIGGALTMLVCVRAHRGVGRPEARPYVAGHWRFGQLYNNREDPALFVPTRNGARWTLNFGRPVAAALLGAFLALGILGPTVLLAIALR